MGMVRKARLTRECRERILLSALSRHSGYCFIGGVVLDVATEAEFKAARDMLFATIPNCRWEGVSEWRIIGNKPQFIAPNGYVRIRLSQDDKIYFVSPGSLFWDNKLNGVIKVELQKSNFIDE